jgi:nucleoside triphosphate diphosphatase
MATPQDGWFARLVQVVRQLRSPGGCPWDREQTLASLRPFVIEEAYEVLDAIDREDHEALRDEIGDLIFEGVLLAQLCAERGTFTIDDSIRAIVEKLVRRHPHVFGKEAEAAGVDASLTAPIHSAGEVLERWEDMKALERAQTGRTRQTLAGIPRSLPSLLRAYEIGKRAATVGFDWHQAADVLEKIDEEVAELREVVEHEAATHPARVEEEMGDLLFALANLSRKLGIEPEAALRRANEKFSTRFTELERRIDARGDKMQGTPLEQLEAEWQQVKADERTPAE